MVSVRCLYGMGGYGVYWAIMEMLSMSEEYRLSKAEYASIAEELNVPEELVAHIVEDHGLFVVSDGYFQSKRISEEMGHKEKVSEAKRRAGMIGMKSRYEKNKPSQDVKTQDPIPTSPQPENGDSQVRKTRTKKYSPEETQLHSRCKEFFGYCYRSYKQTDYYWSGKDMNAIVGILKQIRFHMDEDERDNLEQLWVNYQALIKMIFVRADDWIRANVSPSLIQSKFNEIYAQLKNGTKRTTDESGNARDDLDFMASIAETLQSGND